MRDIDWFEVAASLSRQGNDLGKQGLAAKSDVMIGASMVLLSIGTAIHAGIAAAIRAERGARGIMKGDQQ